MKYVTTPLRGRLGNNMFQAGALYTYAKMHGYEPMVHNNVWGYPIVLRNINVVDNSKVSNFKELIHNHFRYVPIKTDVSDSSINIRGTQCYFQNEKYLDKELVCNLFTMPETLRKSIVEKYPDIKSRCSIHIRRGDYLGNNIWPIHGIDYVTRAKAYVNSNKFMVFSDDIAWCKQNFPKDMNIIFSDDDPETSMYAMSLCEHNIITNSSFSWWGAYLNENENKIVISPKEWFHKNHPVVRNNMSDSDSNIQCESWLKI